MKLMMLIFTVFATTLTFASVPTEEGLLKNLNNAEVSGKYITVKAMIRSMPTSTVPIGAVAGAAAELTRPDFYKFIISIENPNVISFFQVAYSSAQMLNSQVKDVKYIPDLLGAMKKDKNQETSFFYGIYLMLTTNYSGGVEAFLEKSGVQLIKNKNILNGEKIKLLKAYRTYLATNKGKGDVNSPLNPVDPQNKAKTLELFRSNTFERSKNIELVKVENEFRWKVDWKNIKAYFTNEEKRFRLMEYSTGDSVMKIEATDYVLFNGVNELPKNILVKDPRGLLTTIQILALETRKNIDKKLTEQYEEAKKSISLTGDKTNYSFLF